jgi:hypothetical protein
MSSFFKKTIRCSKCGRPCQTIFVCPDCFRRLPKTDKQNFRANTMKGHDTTTHREAMLRKLSGASALAILTAIAATALVIFGLVSLLPEKPKPAPIILTPGVQWLGSPVVAQERATGHLTNVEFGIRDDGVVIWRDKRGPAVNGKRFGQFEMPPGPFKGPDGKILP